jgi:hypothetical protein
MHSTREGRTIIVVVGLLAVAVLLAVLVTSWSGEAAPQEDEGRPIADRFLQQIRDGDVDAAWESTTADFKSDEGLESFRAFVAARPGLSKPAEFLRFEEISVHGLTRWKYTYRVGTPLPSGATEVGVLIANERGQWKVEQLIAP